MHIARGNHPLGTVGPGQQSHPGIGAFRRTDRIFQHFAQLGIAAADHLHFRNGRGKRSLAFDTFHREAFHLDQHIAVFVKERDVKDCKLSTRGIFRSILKMTCHLRAQRAPGAQRSVPDRYVEHRRIKSGNQTLRTGSSDIEQGRMQRKGRQVIEIFLAQGQGCKRLIFSEGQRTQVVPARTEQKVRLFRCGVVTFFTDGTAGTQLPQNPLWRFARQRTGPAGDMFFLPVPATLRRYMTGDAEFRFPIDRWLYVDIQRPRSVVCDDKGRQKIDIQ